MEVSLIQTTADLILDLDRISKQYHLSLETNHILPEHTAKIALMIQNNVLTYKAAKILFDHLCWLRSINYNLSPHFIWETLSYLESVKVSI